MIHEIIFLYKTQEKFCFIQSQEMNAIELDAIDLGLLRQLQQDCSLSNQTLAQRVHVSSATCLRRVKRLLELGLVEKRVAVLQPEVLAQALGHGLTAIVEITLERQDAQALEAFAAHACADDAVQQCYRVSPGPDFCLVVHTRDMPGYLALSQHLFTAHANVRNVKSFFSVQRCKFGAALPF